MKITSAMVDVVERMLTQGLVSQRKIAKLVGISRGTVNSIALGRRPRISDPAAAADAFEPQRGPLVRCPGCGGKVYLPCLLCHVRQLKAWDEGLQACSQRGRLRRETQLHGSAARTCRRPAAHEAAARQPSYPLDRADPQAAIQSRMVAASPSALSPAPGAISCTPAATTESVPASALTHAP